MTAPHPNDIIRLFIHDCRVDLNIGVYEGEMDKPQPVIINIECEGRLNRYYNDVNENALDNIIDYGPYYRFIRHELPQMGHIYFLESVAEKIAAFCLRDERVQTVRIRIEKTAIFPDATGGGIEIHRTRVS